MDDDDRIDTLLRERAADWIAGEPDPPTLETLMARARPHRAVGKWFAVAASSVLILALAVGGTVARKASRTSASSARGSSAPSHSPSPVHVRALTPQQFAVAYAIARSESSGRGRIVTSATALADPGTLTDSNTGFPCTSGTLLHIKLIGTFPDIVTGGSGAPTSTSSVGETVSAVLITADPRSGKACLIGVTTGPVEPDTGAEVLFTG